MERTISSDIDPTMLASKAFDRILQIIQQSNLNFALQVSPFSANISIKKSLVKNKSGCFLLPPEPSNSDENMNSKDVNAAIVTKNIELENCVASLRHELEVAKDDCNVAHRRIQFLEDQLEAKACMEVTANEIHRKEIERKEKNTEKLDVKVCELEDEKQKLSNDLYATKIELTKQYEKVKDITELEEKINDLENENLKLKDVLYGCCECGLWNCECNEDDSRSQPTSQPSSPSATTSETSATQYQPSPGTGLYPWTPPPTPPCIECGGVNFGPSPSSLCFGCIPPFENKSPPSSHSSPSRTPPGTPPLHRFTSRNDQAKQK